MIDKIVRAGNTALSAITKFLAVSFLIIGAVSILEMTGTGIHSAPPGLKGYSPERDSGGPYLEELMKINPDTVGWISLHNTNIDYPIMQGRTDSEYLNKDVFGQYSITGSVFLSVLNDRDFSGPYQLLYGHHMENGSMFGDLDRFLEEDFFYNKDEIRYTDEEGTLFVNDASYDLEVFAVFKTDAYDDMVYLADKDVSETEKLIEYIKEHSLFTRDVGEVEHVLALSTCDSDSYYGRTVLFLKVNDKEGDRS